MTNDGESTGGGSPVDWDRLDRIAERLARSDRFQQVRSQPAFAPDRVVCVCEPGLYPRGVGEARIEITWFRNGEFSIHYHEEHDGGTFDHRWDRHPSEHNTRDHVHLGPDAPTPGEDSSHPRDWRDVLSAVLEEIETRQRGFW